ncbi:unnamed protein product [Cunninghamella blakesleeana]
MINESEDRMFELYEDIKGFIQELIKTNNPTDSNKNYNSLRTTCSEYMDFMQPKNDKEKTMLELLGRLIKFTSFAINIYKQTELDSFSKIFSRQILGKEFAKAEVINGYVELKSYLCANELMYLRNVNDTKAFMEKTIPDTLDKYFPFKRLKYTNYPSVDCHIFASLLKKKEELKCSFNSFTKNDPITLISKGERLHEIWSSALKTCMNVFDDMMENEFNYKSSCITNEETIFIQYPESSSSSSKKEFPEVKSSNHHNTQQKNNKKIVKYGSKRTNRSILTPIRKYNRWTFTEIQALEDGLQKIKKPDWKKIKAVHPGILRNRTTESIGLKVARIIIGLQKAKKHLGVYEVALE